MNPLGGVICTAPSEAPRDEVFTNFTWNVVG
jgi:hypothetical protein